MSKCVQGWQSEERKVSCSLEGLEVLGLKNSNRVTPASYLRSSVSQHNTSQGLELRGAAAFNLPASSAWILFVIGTPGLLAEDQSLGSKRRGQP